MRVLTPFLLLLVVAPACRKKADPPEPVVQAPPPPEEPPPPPPPPCPDRDALAGTWHVVTQVSEGVAGRMAGINGYYTVRVSPVEDDIEDCSVKAVISKDGWGRGSKTEDERLFGEATAKTRDDGYWRFPISLGGADGKTSMVLWLDQTSPDQLQGYFHYTGASWGKAQLYGHAEGRKKAWDGTAVVGSEVQGQLDACGLGSVDMAMDDTCSGTNE